MEEEEELVENPSELLENLQSGEMETDPMQINYEIKRLSAAGIECHKFEQLFEYLAENLDNKQLTEITHALYPGHCNWIEFLITRDGLVKFDVMDLYDFYNDILENINANSCNVCMGDIDKIWSNFYEITGKLYEDFTLDIYQKIHLASLLEFHDELAELLVSYDEEFASTDENAGEVGEYLDLVDPEKIMDPVLQRRVKDMLFQNDW